MLHTTYSGTNCKGNRTKVIIPTFSFLQRIYTAPAVRDVPLLIAILAGLVLQIHCKREDRAQRQADGRKRSLTGTSETDESRLTGVIYLASTQEIELNLYVKCVIISSQSKTHMSGAIVHAFAL